MLECSVIISVIWGFEEVQPMVWNCCQIKTSIYLMLKSELFHQNFSSSWSIKGQIFSSARRNPQTASVQISNHSWEILENLFLVMMQCVNHTFIRCQNSKTVMNKTEWDQSKVSHWSFTLPLLCIVVKLSLLLLFKAVPCFFLANVL